MTSLGEVQRQDGIWCVILWKDIFLPSAIHAIICSACCLVLKDKIAKDVVVNQPIFHRGGGEHSERSDYKMSCSGCTPFEGPH